MITQMLIPKASMMRDYSPLSLFLEPCLDEDSIYFFDYQERADCSTGTGTGWGNIPEAYNGRQFAIAGFDVLQTVVTSLQFL